MIAAVQDAATAFAGSWVGEALIGSTLLCLLVLAIRRPVARWFGPGVAYALWLMPAARMLLPPVALPGWLPTLFADAPVPAAAPPMALAVQEGPVPAMVADGAAPVATIGIDALLLLVALWLGGALVMLGWQLWTHWRLMRAIDAGETLGWEGRVRIVASADVGTPLSAGLWRPVVVLPDARRLALDPVERELAITHELTHHRRGDLWFNAGAVLFAALHWFNPVVRHAWRAFRFDQEAACDAIVLARADAPVRTAYARALAKAASGRPAAFAAAMLGQDRLKERLTMLIQPSRSTLRRSVGLMLGAAAMVAGLGLTATPVLADPAEPETPVAPPAPPAPPASPEAAEPLVIAVDSDTAHVTRIRQGDGTTIILRTNRRLDQAEIDTLVAEARASRRDAEDAVDAADAADAAAEIAEVAAADARDAADGNARERRETRSVIVRNHDARRRDAEVVRIVARARAEAAGEAAAAMAEARADAAEAVAEARREGARIESANVITFRSIRDGGAQGDSAACDRAEEAAVFATTDAEDGDRTVVRVVQCRHATREVQLLALRHARDAMADMEPQGQLSRERIDRAVARLDRRIAELERETD